MSTITSTQRRPRLRSLLAATAVALSALAFVPSSASADQDVVVSPVPDPRHPRVMNGRVYDIDSAGPLVAVGGSFTAIRPGSGGADQARQWLFMYNSATGQIVQTFLPELRGPAPDPTNGYVKEQPGVEAVEFAPDGQSLYVGGWFTEVNGTVRNRIVQLNLDGSIRASFSGRLGGTVSDLALVGNRLIVAGRFDLVNGQPMAKLASLNPLTGATQTDFNLPATESRNQFPAYVNEIDASPDGKWLAVSGSFMKIGTAPRNQLALIDLQGTPSVADWSTELYVPNCSGASTNSGSYIRGIDISPDSSYLVVSSTGAFIGQETMCDTASRWELPPTKTGANLRFTWRNHTGGDTLWANEVTESAVYVGGHQRWMNNPRPSPGGDNDGPGSVVRAGIAALDPLTGVPLSWNPGRDRGRGVESIHANDDYLFVGHDTDLFGGQIRQRLAGLPVSGGTANPQPVDIDLPVNLYFTDGASLNRASFDGTTIGSSTTVSGPGVDGETWSSARGGFVQNGKLHYFGDAQAFYSRPFTDGSIGAPTNLSTSVGYVDTNYDLTPYDQPYGVAETTAATYSNGRIYYVKSGDSRLYQRGYSLESGIIGGDEYVASSESFASARALNFIGDWLYAAWDDGRLYRFHAPDGVVDYASRVIVDNGSTINWANVRGFWSTQGGAPVDTIDPTVTVTAPTNEQQVTTSSVSTSGTAADNVGVTEVRVAVSNRNGGASTRWLQANGTWGPAYAFRTATLGSPGATATTWSLSVTLPDGAYALDVRALDARQNETSPGASVPFTVNTVPADTTAPTVAVGAPAKNATLTSGSVAVSGSAADNQSVRQVRVAVYNRNNPSAPWLQADGTWGSRYAFRAAALASPGAASTAWNLGVNLPDGLFALDVKSVDGANLLSSTTWVPFTVNTPSADRVPPNARTTAPPRKRAVVKSRTVRLAGTASDNRAVRYVLVAVSKPGNSAKRRWMQPNGRWGEVQTFRRAKLSRPGGKATDWKLTLRLAKGKYALNVLSVDASSNLDRTPSKIRLTVKTRG